MKLHCSNILSLSLRIILGIYLILFGIKNFSEISTNIKFFKDNIQNIKILKNDLSTYSNEILVFEYCSMIYGGLLLVFGYKLSKLFISFSMLIEIIFIIDVWKLNDESRIKYCLNLLSILGGVFYY